MKQLNPVPLVFLALILLGWHYSGMSLVFIINEKRESLSSHTPGHPAVVKDRIS